MYNAWMYDVYDLSGILLLAIMVMLWWRGSGRHTKALRYARQHCESLGLQLLDETLVQKKLHWERNQHGFLQAQRHYEFDFCSGGLQRYRGRLIMIGSSIGNIELEAHQYRF